MEGLESQVATTVLRRAAYRVEGCALRSCSRLDVAAEFLNGSAHLAVRGPKPHKQANPPVLGRARFTGQKGQ